MIAGGPVGLGRGCWAGTSSSTCRGGSDGGCPGAGRGSRPGRGGRKTPLLGAAGVKVHVARVARRVALA